MIYKLLKHLKNGTLLHILKRNLLVRYRVKFNDFPLKRSYVIGSRTFIGKNIQIDSNFEESYCMILQENRSFYRGNYFDIPKLEILKAKKSFVFKTNLDRPAVLPIGIINDGTVLKIDKSNQKYSIDYSSRTDYKNKYIYLSTDDKESITISSNKEVLFGNVLYQTQKQKTKKKLVLQIFIDGLSQLVFESDKMRELMPNTMEFFKNGIDHGNCYSNSEWTLPSSASIFTGCHTDNHGLFHSFKDSQISSNIRLISEYFQENDYFTFMVSPVHRQSPLYGYARGFDRVIYRRNGFTVSDVIYQFKEQMNAFPNRSTYAFLSIFDLHDVFNKILPDISLQVQRSLASHSSVERNNTEPVFQKKESFLQSDYEDKISYIDYHLSEIYSLINERFEDEDVTVLIVSDHGQSFLSDFNHVLGLDRTHVKFMLKDSLTSIKEHRSIIQNVDILPTLLDIAEIDYDKNCVDGTSIFQGNNVSEFTFSQSIFPGQTYKACIRNLTYQYYFESNTKLDNKLIIDIHNAKYSKYDFDNNKVDITNEDVKFILKYIMDHINSGSYLRVNYKSN